MALNGKNVRMAAFGASTVNDSAAVEAGLRSYMLKVYNLMALGVAVTGIVTLLMASSQQLTYTLAVGPMKWVLFFGLLAMGWMSPKIMTMRSSAMANAFYWTYCVLWGVMISPMILFFLQTPEGVMDIARAFLITAGAFAGLSIYGYSTKRNLAPIATFATMAIIGLIIAGFVNMIFFEASTQFSMWFSIGAVLLFAAITAFQVQQIKSLYYANAGNEAIGRYAIFGALQLYANFIIMFIHILNLLGIMRNE